MKLMLALCIG